MGQTEVSLFLLVVTFIIFVFIGGLVIFVLQYRRRRLLHDKEKQLLNEQHKQALLTSQLQVQQQTMQFIGREIHDSVGQKLTLASLYTQQMSYQNQHPESNTQLVQIANILNESLSELRMLSKNLTDEQQQQADLIALLQKECEQVNASGLCKVSFTANTPAIAMGQVQKNVVLRIAQEFMQNSLKHAGCTLITVTLQLNSSELNLQLLDNGKGFELTALQQEGRGIGLHNMQRRAEAAGAILNLNSVLNSGTKLTLQMQIE